MNYCFSDFKETGFETVTVIYFGSYTVIFSGNLKLLGDTL